MKPLSGLDAAFLYLETPEMPMHVGALHVFELPAGYTGRFVRDLRAHMAKRLAIVPALRRKVWWMPLNLTTPAWVDAEPDLQEHIVEVKLPKAARDYVLFLSEQGNVPVSYVGVGPERKQTVHVA